MFGSFVCQGRVGGARAADHSATERRWSFPAGGISPTQSNIVSVAQRAEGAGFQKWPQHLLRCRVSDRWARSDLFVLP